MAAPIPAQTAQTVWSLAVNALAEVRARTSAEVLQEAGEANGDIVIKSKEAEAVISLVEEALGDVVLVDQSHLRDVELTSLHALAELLWRRYRAACDDRKSS